MHLLPHASLICFLLGLLCPLAMPVEAADEATRAAAAFWGTAGVILLGLSAALAAGCLRRTRVPLLWGVPAAMIVLLLVGLRLGS